MIIELSPPRQRLVHCCLKRPHSTYELQSKIGAMNVPDHVMWLRRMLGLIIPCILKPMINRDGKRIKSGEYSFTDNDKRKVKAYLGLIAINPENKKPCDNDFEVRK
ncbi:hypothetical protein MNBD_GAMMA01-735 [hydrothermal vent metagenome]|uniref:Uncharacterized protein n=1 Tax=hydrothermal vent metagenome TaxID=652676 RepID=A0A3B0VNC7_9ZZZZ